VHRSGRGDARGSASHTATHFGGPLACAAATATLSAIEARGLAGRAREVGARFRETLAKATRGRGVREVRGRGLMVGVALEGGSGRALAVSRALLLRGWLVLTGGEAGDVLTLTPALDIEDALLDAFAVALAAALERAP
jgi:acetylornithine/succinyldiaminopimelate/putrescine aminotransferase